MKKSLKVLVAVAVAGMALSQTAGAATPLSHSFQVKLVVQASCTFGSSNLTAIDLGSHATNTTNREQIGNLVVNCTNGATPIVKMQSADWKLKDNKGGQIEYQILKSDNNVWDQNGVTFTSTGGDMTIPVKAKVANVGNKAGTFTDMVTVSIDF